jgi:hypothetical protein
MKATLSAFLLAGFIFTGLPARAALPGKVQIAVVKTKGDTVRAGGKGEGSQAKTTENISYTVTVKNTTFADLPALTVDYVLFVERPKLGEKKREEPRVERVTGSKKLEALPRQTPQVVTTDEVTLTTENLVGNYIYANGGRIKAEDSIIGVWVRVSQDGQIVGEYALPTTITKRGWENPVAK